MMGNWITLLLHIWKVPGPNLVQRPAILTEVFNGFLVNSEIRTDFLSELIMTVYANKGIFSIILAYLQKLVLNKSDFPLQGL
jgi:hypothetical protein